VRPTIAVIVPNWNDAQYLPRCLRSVLDQEDRPDELIVVDDQSTDNSVEVIRTILSGVPGTELIVNPRNLGTNGALNAGLARTRSDYVLFLASNDFVLPGIFSRARASFSRWPDVGLWSAMIWLVDEQDRAIRLHPSPVVAVRDHCFTAVECVGLARRFGNWFTGTTLIYRRSVLDAVGGFDPAYGGLSDLLTALTLASLHGAAFSPEPLAAVRVHRGSFLSGTLKNVERVDGMLDRLAQRGPVLSPALFDAEFLRRTGLRFRFACVRAGGAPALAAVAERLRGWQSVVLRTAGRLLPAGPSRLRTLVAFLVLRPFDIVPTAVNRVLGWAWIRLRLYSRGGSRP